MAFTQLIPVHTPPIFPPRRSYLPIRNLNLFRKIPLRTRRIPLPVVSCSLPKPPIPTTEQDILQVVADFDGADDKALPGVRTYENNLARLTLVGAVDFEQALTAAAADGGEAAKEHIESGMPAMVVETLFPGLSDEHSTVSTRLFLPARKVKEKAKKLKSIITDDILSSTSSKNVLAMTFRQVVLQQIWNFEVVLFRPGMERNMENLEKPREVPASFKLSSSDERLISVLAEVICLSALESTESHFQDNSLGRSDNLFSFFQKPKWFLSKDSSVIISKLLEDELVGNAKSLLEKFNSEKANNKLTGMKLKYNWWTLSAFSKFDKIGGPEFSTWVSEYVPAYRLQINNNKVSNIKFEGWKNTSDHWWEVLLTHSQMVGLANILDMYYEDVFTLPNKQLSCGAITKSTNLSINKRSFSLLKILSTILVSGLALVTISVLGQLFLPYLHNGRNYQREFYSLPSSDTESIHQQSVESTKLEAFAISIISKIKDTLGWPGEIVKQSGGGAWTGELPKYLRRVVEADNCGVDFSSITDASEKSDEEIKASAQDIASYQVVLSAEGKIVGIQPTSRVAVNQWAANPLAKELYGGRKLSPGFIEPGLKISGTSDVVVLELLMSVNPDSHFALARPAKL